MNRAARVMAAGHDGQILLAAATAGLVDPVDLVDLGRHRLRDLSGTQHLFQVCADGQLRVFPTLRTLNAVPGNLPADSPEYVPPPKSSPVRGTRLPCSSTADLAQ